MSMSREILQNKLENKSGSGVFKPSEVLHLARRRMLRETDTLDNEDITRRYPYRFQGVYCGNDVRLLIRNRKGPDSRDLFLTPDGSPEFPTAHIQVSGQGESVLYTYAGKTLYVSDSIDKASIGGKEHLIYGTPIEAEGPLAQAFNYMMLDVERPRLSR